MKAAELAEKLLEHPRANVVIMSPNGGADPIDVRYNPLTNDIYVETE